MSTENEQTPGWAKPIEDLISAINTAITDGATTPAQPAKAAQPAKTDGELIAENIAGETARITGRQDPNPISTFSSSISPKPTGGGDFSHIADQINQGTKQIVEQSKKK